MLKELFENRLVHLKEEWRIQNLRILANSVSAIPFAQKQNIFSFISVYFNYFNLQTVWENWRHIILSLNSFSALSKPGMPQDIWIILRSNNSWGVDILSFFFFSVLLAEINNTYYLWSLELLYLHQSSE